MKRFLLAVVFLSPAIGAQVQSKWLTYGPDDKLRYGASAAGDHFPDYSVAGYESGGVALPRVPAVMMISPTGGDDTAAIQAAIDKLSTSPAKGNFRGAIELAAGTFHVAGQLHINASGIVLRGHGAGNGGTVIQMTGAPHRALEIGGHLVEESVGAPTAVTDSYVPFGSRVLHVADARSVQAGDTVRITKAITPAWVAFMGMDKLTRSGREEHWVGTDHLSVRRRVTAVRGNTLELDVALMDSYDARWTGEKGTTVEPIRVTGQVDHVGVEAIHLQAQPRSIALDDPHYDGIYLRDARDCWFRDLELEDVTEGLRLELNAERSTVTHVDVTQHAAITSSAKNFQFTGNGSQLLFDHISGQGNSVFYFASQARAQGPMVVLNCHFEGDGRIEPHQRWGTGLLVDGCSVPHGGINMINRGIMGSGHGWTIGWPVVWNSKAQFFTIQQAPGTLSWAIGNCGEQRSQAMPTGDGNRAHNPPLPPGLVELQCKKIAPRSLYLAQMLERLGKEGLKNIGYSEKDAR